MANVIFRKKEEEIMPLSESQLQALQNVLSVAIGSGSTVLVQWIANKRSKSKEKEDATQVISDSASENVKAAQMVIEMLQEMISDQKTYFDNQIKRAEENCSNQIKEQTTIIENLKENNESLHIAIARLEKENTSLSVELVRINTEYNVLKGKYDDLKRRFSKYENEIVTGDHTEAIKKAREELKKQNKKNE